MNTKLYFGCVFLVLGCGEKEDTSVINQLDSILSLQASSGSVPYGLPTIALTRRTLDVQIRSK